MRLLLPAFCRCLGELALAALALVLSAQAGTFKNPALIDTTSDPIGVASADFNHDGKIDLVYVDGLGGLAGSTLHILLGNGDGTFRHGEDISLPAGICGYASCMINLADVTNDSNVDIVIGGSNTSTAQLGVLVGNGDGTFQAPIISNLPNFNGNYPALNGHLAIGDVNGDGAMDIIAVDTANNLLEVLLGNNSGSFTFKGSQPLYFGGAATVYLYDVNGDGHLDIVANDLLGAVTFVLLGNGDGTFQSQVTYSTYAWLFADMDGDGHPDLVGVEYGQGVVVSKGNPDGTFGTPTPVASIPVGGSLAAIADYNGDGIPDLVFVTPTGVAVALGQGGLTYAAPTASVAGVPALPFLALVEIAPGDFNGDGHNDLAMGVDGGILILLGSGSGSFASADYFDVGYPVGVAAVADFDGKGVPDIAVTVPATYPRILLGTGSGTFTLAPDQNHSYTTQAPAGSLAVGDFNGDGKPDLDFLQPSGQTFVWYNTANDTFSSPLGVNAGPTLTADFNNDGRSDLVSVSNSASNSAITAMLGQTNSTFTTVTTPLWYATQGVAAIGDLNNDRKPDLLTYEDPGVRIWLGNGDGTFSHSNLITLPGQGIFGAVMIADLDGDGNKDIILCPASISPPAPSTAVIFYGNGDGTFQAPVLLPLSHDYTKGVVQDINGDNKPDLILSDGSGIAVITNLGNRSFSPEDHYVAGAGINQLNVVDVNGDGFPDIVAANNGGTTITVLLNQPNGIPLDGASSAGAFTVTPSPSNYSQPITLKIAMSASAGGALPTGTVTFYFDGAYITDVVLASGVASYSYTQAPVPGTHTLVAAYNGDSTYSAESFAVLQTVNPPVYPTKTSLTANPKTLFTSQTVHLSAKVTSAVPIPAGWITFMDGSNSLGAQQIDSNGAAVMDSSTLGAGTHQISSVYQGYQDPFNVNAIYQPSTSPSVSVTVNALPTSTAISASNSSPTSGSVLTFTASVSSGSSLPFGGVSFYDGGILLGTMSLNAGTASFSTASLSVGSHTITAVFNSNATFGTSTSPPLNITIGAASAALAPSLVIVNLQSSTGASALSAQVMTDGSVTGTATFLDSGTILGTATVNPAGRSVLPITSFSSRLHNVSVSFSGDPRFAPSVSPDFIEQWPPTGPGFSIDLARESLTAGSAQDPLPINIVPIGNFSQPVTLACGSELPAGYVCVFSPTSVPGRGMSYLTVQRTTEAHGDSRRGSPVFVIALGVLALLLVPSRKQRSRHVLSLLVGLNFLLLGCGISGPHTLPQSKVVAVKATSGRGSNLIIHSAQVIVRIPPEQ